ncbi:MAG: DNA mismatch repair endonuclease MutL, partial [Acidobacteriota bacterium]
MNRIQVLPEILANKIAAGEIVERPASVVKELIENSLDAGSSSISIDIQSGGKRLILVRDDGFGMSQDDAIMAFEHHATSKIKTVEDLGSIASLGFRGEALPSIASVSRLTLKTRSEDFSNSSGTVLEIQGGILRSVKPTPWDKGTEIAVRDLFFNVPARRKFLKTNDTENGHIARHVTHYALVHPEIRFTLKSGDRVLLDTIPVQSLKERVYQVFGESFLENLTEFQGSSGEVTVHGFSSKPHEQRTNAYSQYFYVNQRMVRDKVLTGAVRQAYRRCMPASVYPVVILFLELPFDQVDVNAHPAKTEIRFHNQKTVFNLVKNTLERAIASDAHIPEFDMKLQPSYPFKSIPAGGAYDPDGLSEANSIKEAEIYRNPSYTRQNSLQYPLPDDGKIVSSQESSRQSHHAPNGKLPDVNVQTGRLFQGDSVRIMGQFRDSYIIAADSGGLLIIDQHVAHERILYEGFSASLTNHSVKTQGLLTPISFDLPPHQAALLEKVTPELISSGFEIEHFGGTSILVRSVPAITGESDCRELLKEILENLETEDRGLDLERIRDRIAVKTACHAAIKVNMPLSVEKMQWLVEMLSRTGIPTNCPHG